VVMISNLTKGYFVSCRYYITNYVTPVLIKYLTFHYPLTVIYISHSLRLKTVLFYFLASIAFLSILAKPQLNFIISFHLFGRFSRK